MTYWASCVPVLSLGGTVVFADIRQDSLCVDPEDIERSITRRSKAIVFGHYARHGSFVTIPEIKAGAGIPWGGYKYRLNQLCSAIGREQLKNYGAQMAEIDRAMNFFWDRLEGIPGIRGHRPAADSGNTMGGWYNPLGHELPGCLALKRPAPRRCG
jgi:dTDP-4-amino-4,6-dideoxygalactose transaminase